MWEFGDIAKNITDKVNNFERTWLHSPNATVIDQISGNIATARTSRLLSMLDKIVVKHAAHWKQ